MAGAVLAVLVTGHGSPKVALLIGLALVAMCLGFIDDLRGLGVRIRLLAVVALATVFGSMMALETGHGPALAVGVVVAVAFLILAHTNAFNFMDGINGISGLTTAAVGLFFAWQSGERGLPELQALGLAVAVAGLAFLPFNVPRARLFLGDSGSYALGFLLAAIGIWFGIETSDWWLAAAPFALYFLDTGFTLLRRAGQGKPLSQPHREHTYQRLSDGLGSHVGASFIVAAAVALFCLSGVLGQSYPLPGIGAAAALAVAYLLSPRLIGRAEA